MGTWLQDIIQSVTELGGTAHYSDLYLKIKEMRTQKLPNSWHAIIRRTIETNSSDSEAFGGEDLFYSCEGIGKGVWGLRNYSPTTQTVDLTEDDLAFPEGKILLRKHILRERNPRLIFEAKKAFKQKHSTLFCEVCHFDFEKKYGQLGTDFIEAHHIKPISETGENEITKVSDIIMVCSNCHRMLHRKRPWLSKTQLQTLIFE